jgi:hypothetical protein
MNRVHVECLCSLGSCLLVPFKMKKVNAELLETSNRAMLPYPILILTILSVSVISGSCIALVSHTLLTRLTLLTLKVSLVLLGKHRAPMLPRNDLLSMRCRICGLSMHVRVINVPALVLQPSQNLGAKEEPARQQIQARQNSKFVLCNHSAVPVGVFMQLPILVLQTPVPENVCVCVEVAAFDDVGFFALGQKARALGEHEVNDDLEGGKVWFVELLS